MNFHHWVADGLMAIIFLLVGLEVKREWYEGRLATAEARRLPILAAIAGMGVPAVVYLLSSGFNGTLVRGWAIPAATDIAFVIGLLALLGPHAPASLRLLLVTIAIVDDIGAVAIIALAYTDNLNGVALGAAAAITGIMASMGLFGVRRIWALLCGVGFTMSLFIGALAFPGREEMIDAAKIGTLGGSMVAAMLGCLVLWLSSPIPFRTEDDEEYGRVFSREHRD